jgi:hypothetical protein
LQKPKIATIIPKFSRGFSYWLSRSSHPDCRGIPVLHRGCRPEKL